MKKELIQRIGTLPYDFTIHDLDLVRYMMGSNIKEIYAKGGTLIDPTLKSIGDVLDCNFIPNFHQIIQ